MVTERHMGNRSRIQHSTQTRGAISSFNSRAYHSKTEWIREVQSMEQRQLELVEGLGRGLALRDPQNVESHSLR